MLLRTNSLPFTLQQHLCGHARCFCPRVDRDLEQYACSFFVGCRKVRVLFNRCPGGADAAKRLLRCCIKRGDQPAILVAKSRS